MGSHGTIPVEEMQKIVDWCEGQEENTKLNDEYSEGFGMGCKYTKRKIQSVIDEHTNDNDENDILSKIILKDSQSTNGGCYISKENRDKAEQLVDEGAIVRLKNPAGASPIYVPMSSNHYSEKRLNNLREKQSSTE